MFGSLSTIASFGVWVFTHFFWQLVALALWVVLWVLIIQPLIRKYKGVASFEHRFVDKAGGLFKKLVAYSTLFKTTATAIGLSAYLQSLSEATETAANSAIDMGPDLLQDVQSLDLKLIFNEHLALQLASYVPMAIVVLHWLAKVRDISIEPKKE
jgi:hypothetical protein